MNRSKWIIICYSALLLIACTVFFVISNLGSHQRLSSSDVVRTAEQADYHFYEEAVQGSLEQLEGVFVAGEWTHNHNTGKGLKIILKGDSDGLLVTVSQHAAGVEQIHAKLYTTRTIISRLDVTDMIDQPKVEFSGSQLVLTMPERKELTFAQLNREFTITQFLGKEIEDSSHIQTWGSKVLHLKIPADVQINHEDMIDVRVISGS